LLCPPVPELLLLVLVLVLVLLVLLVLVLPPVPKSRVGGEHAPTIASPVARESPMDLCVMS